MPNIYVARSASLQEWSADVGLTDHVYKVGVADGGAEAAVTALSAESFAGATDWKLLKEEAVETVDMNGVAEKLARKERPSTRRCIRASRAQCIFSRSR